MNSKKEREKIESQAEKLVKRGKLEDAIVEYQKMLMGDEQDIPIRTTMGDLYVQLDQKSKAAGEFLTISKLYEKKGLYSKSTAMLKRVIRLNPSDLDTIKKLAQLYQNQGFTSEARTEYKKLADAFHKKNEIKPTIHVYESLLKITPNDMEVRCILADLYQKESLNEKALVELNHVAEHYIRKNNHSEAEKLLNQAKKINQNDARTLTNLIELLKRQNKKKEALSLVTEVLKKDRENVKALYILAHLFFEEKNFEKAEEVLNRIITLRPKEAEARIKIGKILLQKEEKDKALEMYIPLVDTLVRKKKEDQAIGLLGLILADQKIHMPTLEKLLTIYRGKLDNEGFEAAGRILLEEYKRRNQKEKMLPILKDLVGMFAENEEYYFRFRRLKEDMGVSDEDIGITQAPVRVDEIKEIVDTTLSKADLYVEQGLMRNAKRILENLRIRFPEETRIAEKIEKISQLPAPFDPNDIADRIEKVQKRESQILGKISDFTQNAGASLYDGNLGEDKLSAADIFAETDLIPMISEDGGKRKFYDLSQQVSEELSSIKAIIEYQISGDTMTVEKVLADIVGDFRKTLDEKIAPEDYECHYNLGIAFLEQGLLNEAIEECQKAAKSKKLQVDSYSIISFCYRQKKNLPEAKKWLDQAFAIAQEGSYQYFALKYELASLFEAMNDLPQAVKLFQEVKNWNSNYRDVGDRIQSLNK